MNEEEWNTIEIIEISAACFILGIITGIIIEMYKLG